MIHRLTLVLLLLVNTSVCAVDNITILGLFTDKAIVELDGKRRVLSKGVRSPEGVILISANSSEAVLEIGGKRSSYSLGTRIQSSFKKPVAQTMVFIPPDGQGMYRVNGSINGFQMSFVVDTGATLISMNEHEAKRLGINYKIDGEESLSSTASGLDKIYIINLKKVKVGDIELHNIKGAVHKGDFPRVILLGNSFLSRVNMRREGSMLQLQKRH